MRYAALVDKLDEDYEGIHFLSEEKMIDYLVRTYDADPDVARRALVTYGLIEE